MGRCHISALQLYTLLNLNIVFNHQLSTLTAQKGCLSLSQVPTHPHKEVSYWNIHMIHYSLFITVEGRLKTKWVIVIVPLIPYFICPGHVPKSCSRPRPNISHYKAVSVCVCVGSTTLARVWHRPFFSFMASLGWGLMICTRLCFTQIYFKWFSSRLFDVEAAFICVCRTTMTVCKGTCMTRHSTQYI